jgi:hypothetical protein
VGLDVKTQDDGPAPRHTKVLESDFFVSGDFFPEHRRTPKKTPPVNAKVTKTFEKIRAFSDSAVARQPNGAASAPLRRFGD